MPLSHLTGALWTSLARLLIRFAVFAYVDFWKIMPQGHGLVKTERSGRPSRASPHLAGGFRVCAGESVLSIPTTRSHLAKARSTHSPQQRLCPMLPQQSTPSIVQSTESTAGEAVPRPYLEGIRCS